MMGRRGFLKGMAAAPVVGPAMVQSLAKDPAGRSSFSKLAMGASTHYPPPVGPAPYYGDGDKYPEPYNPIKNAIQDLYNLREGYARDLRLFDADPRRSLNHRPQWDRDLEANRSMSAAAKDRIQIERDIASYRQQLIDSHQSIYVNRLDYMPAPIRVAVCQVFPDLRKLLDRALPAPKDN